MKITDIKLNPGNPRFIRDDNFAKLTASIKEFPKMMELRPIIVDDKGIILGGNMRYRALKELGYKDLPDSWVREAKEFTPEELRRFIVQDNIGFGEWDYDILANEYDAAELEKWGLEIPLYDEPEVALPDGDKMGSQMTFNLTPDQIDEVNRALAAAKKEITGNEINDNSNGNALFYISRRYNEHS